MQAVYLPSVDLRKPTFGRFNLRLTSGTPDAMAAQKTYPEIAARLIRVRRAFGGDHQRDWALSNGFNQGQYNHWETGARRIPLEAAEKLAATYGLTLDWIYLGRRDGLSDSAAKVL